MKRAFLTMTPVSVLAILPEIALSQSRPDRATMRQIMNDLGVAPSDMRRCFGALRSHQGSDPTEAQRAAIRENLFACLQQANPALTQDQFVDAMRQFPRPI